MVEKISSFEPLNLSSNTGCKCKCCPYGQHVNIDFVEFAKDYSNEGNDIQKIRRYQRKFERTKNDMVCMKSETCKTHNIVEYDLDQSHGSGLISDVGSNMLNLKSSDKNQQTCSTVIDHHKQNITSKSFVVSYEHLMSIREQMSTSLQRVQELENEVKHINNLKMKIDELSRKNNELECQLVTLNNGNVDKLLNWKDHSDVPNHIISNIERLYQIDLTNEYIKSKQKTNCHKYIDTYSSYSKALTNRQIQTDLNPQKGKRRNFGVTVKPISHHFTQQITTTPIFKGYSNSEHLTNFEIWSNTLENKHKIQSAKLIHDLFELCLNGLYQESLILLYEKIKNTSDTSCQTYNFSTNSVKSSQTNIEYENFSKQILPISNEKYTETKNVRFDKILTDDILIDNVNSQCLSVDLSEQTIVKHHQDTFSSNTFIVNDESVINETKMYNISSCTDEHLFDDFVATYIEKSMDLIYEELKAEMIQSNNEKPHITENYSDYIIPISNAETQTKSCKNMVDIFSCYTSNIEESTSSTINPTLHISKINFLSILDPEIKLQKQEEQQNLFMDLDKLSSSYLSLDVAENNSAECINESTNNAESEFMPDKETVLKINSNIIKQDGDTNLYLPPEIKEACELVSIWMNDSTSIYSKDLNESLAVIRKFWFDISADNSINIKCYLDQFQEFNSIMKEKIINMTDNNGNTCLHYAASEGRWQIVQIILETGLACVNKTNKAGYTVLMLAALSDELEEDVVRALIRESDIDKHSINEVSQTALMIAASRGRNHLVQWLLDAGASVNLIDSDGSTALMCACDNGHIEVVQILLTRSDLDTEIEDNTGSNAMKIALDNSFKDIALLIFARNNFQKGVSRSKKRSGSNSHPTSPLSHRKFK